MSLSGKKRLVAGEKKEPKGVRKELKSTRRHSPLPGWDGDVTFVCARLGLVQYSTGLVGMNISQAKSPFSDTYVASGNNIT